MNLDVYEYFYVYLLIVYYIYLLIIIRIIIFYFINWFCNDKDIYFWCLEKKVNYYFVISLNYIGGLLNINKFNMKL